MDLPFSKFPAKYGVQTKSQICRRRCRRRCRRWARQGKVRFEGTAVVLGYLCNWASIISNITEKEQKSICCDKIPFEKMFWLQLSLYEIPWHDAQLLTGLLGSSALMAAIWANLFIDAFAAVSSKQRLVGGPQFIVSTALQLASSSMWQVSNKVYSNRKALAHCNGMHRKKPAQLSSQVLIYCNCG